MNTRILFILIVFFQAILVSAQDFYDMTQVQTIEINFEQNNWDQLLDNAYSSSGDYILAKSVSINGIAFDSVGVKYKGNSTYNPNQTKNPFHIELDTYKDQEYDGYTDIKLSNVAKDPSFLREVLSYQIIRQYMDAPLSNYANVYVNGDLIGLYSNSESISKKFVNSRFYSKKNTFVKCNPPAGAGPNTNDFPNLAYLGDDSTSYYLAYELKSDNGWNELIHLCDTLKNHTDEVENILDVDRALWMLALNNVLVNLDSYIGGFKQNYYLYRDDNGRFIPVIWDLNESFGRFSMTGSGNLNGTVAKQQMDHLLHVSDANFPLVQNLLSTPLYKRMYLAHYKTILLENFDNDFYLNSGQTLQDLISNDVQSDNNKFFTYDNFLDNLTTDINAGGGGPGGGATVGIANLMDGRNDYLLGLADFSNTEPIITDISFSKETPIINETLGITARIINEEQAFLGYKINQDAPFRRVAMFDDGMHNDGAANDNIYGVDIVIESAFTQFYIYADNSNIGKFSPQRAEYEYHLITANSTNTEIGDLVINELLASNDVTIFDQDEEYDDWIELYNNGSLDINLNGYFLSDDVEDLMKWPFPEEASISAGSYFMVWADNDDQEGVHANFKLSSSGESLFLVNVMGMIVDEVTFANQETDISFGRFPNGTGNFQIMNPTFSAQNDGALTSIFVPFYEENDLSIFPNPILDRFEISASENLTSVSIYNGLGVKVLELFPEANSAMLNMSHLSNGIYIVKAATKSAPFKSRLISKLSTN